MKDSLIIMAAVFYGAICAINWYVIKDLDSVYKAWRKEKPARRRK